MFDLYLLFRSRFGFQCGYCACTGYYRHVGYPEYGSSFFVYVGKCSSNLIPLIWSVVFKHGYVCALIHVLYEAHTVPSSCLLLHSHDGSIHEYVFTLIEDSRLSASAVGGWYCLVSRSPCKSVAMEI